MPPTYEEVERAIAEVAGVASASVGPATGTGRGRLRLRLHAGYDADTVSEAVAATLRDRFGIDVDPAAIRPREPDPVPDRSEPARESAPDATPVAEQDAGTAAVIGGSATPTWDDLVAAGDPARNGEVLGFVRPRIVEVEQRIDGLETTATVVLEIEDRLHQGRLVAAATPSAGLRAIARAALLAVDDSLHGQARSELELLDAGDDRITVAVTFLTHDGPEDLLGIALVRDGNVALAVVRATLDALNRRIGFLLREEPVLASN